MSENIDIVEFARKVERLCDFLIDQYREKNSRDGSPDLVVLEDLKDEAADIQASENSPRALKITGLAQVLGSDKQYDKERR